MVLLPLPADVHERLNLISHELFHRAQPYLHFNTWSYTNYQLDKKEGRIYLRLELKALKAALDAPSAKESLKHITDAFIFRKYRNKLFPGTDTTENTLELNEGMAEYTGLMLSDRPEARMKIHLTGKIDDFQRSNSFVRSFPYVTIPAYGYLLSRKDKYWNKKINNQTNLASFFINEFGIQIPDNLENGVEKIKDLYNGKEIEQQESEREEKNKHLIAGYENRFLKQPHLIIPLEKMNYSFDPQTVITLGNEGIYYPTIQLTDNWGILKAENGSLISKDFSRINLTSPTDTTGNVIVGDGWILELKKGYAINKHPGDNNYYLEKNGN